MQLSLAPLEGITTPIFRCNIDTHFGGIDKFYTPFISADSSYNFRKREKDEFMPYEPRLVPQLIANDPDYFIHAAKKISEIGYTEINLNMGCPAATVFSKGKGSGMLSDLDGLKSFFDRVFSENDMPAVSVKTRIGIEDDSHALQLAEIFAEFPIYEVIIHPRTRADLYKGPIHIDTFKKMAEIIGFDRIAYNGDIRTPEDLARLQEQLPLCRHFMIGRGLITDPSLCRQIRGGAAVDRKELAVFLNSLWTDYETRHGVEKQLLDKMKELWTYLSTNFPDNKRALKELKKARRAAEYRAAVREILKV